MIESIGEGGMGQVWLARDPDLNRRVAVKVLRPEVAVGGARAREARARLVREAQAMASLAHPNVIAVHEVGDHGERVFLVMELVTGGTLADWRQQAGRSVPEILAMLIQAGRGLAAAHAAGLVHRDFKPANVLVGEDQRARVTDFGLVGLGGLGLGTAPTLSDLEPTSLTMTGALLGTPSYMSPEQLRSDPTTARSDQFSFCITLYEALYGERPFAGDRFQDLIANVEAGTMRPTPRQPRLPARVSAALRRGLAVDPEARFPSMTALIDALEATPRRRPVLAGIAAALVVGGGATAWLAWPDDAGRRDPPAAVLVVDAAPAPAPVVEGAAPLQLTELGGCSTTPVYLDDQTVAFSHSVDDTYDLWTVPLAGGPPARLSPAAGIYTDSNPTERPGEVVVIRWTIDDRAFVERILADRTIVPMATPQALATSNGLVHRGDSLIFLGRDRMQIRRLRGGVEEAVTSLPPAHEGLWMSGSPDGRWLVVYTWRTWGYCLVDLHADRPEARCQAEPDVAGAVVAGPDNQSYYVPTYHGVWRRRYDGGPAQRVSAATVETQRMAIAPDQRTLVYTTCDQGSRLVAIGGEPRPPLVAAALGITVHRNGAIAMSRGIGGGSVISILEPDGTLRDLTARGHASVRDPSWSRDGERVVYRQAGDGGGIFTVAVQGTAPERISDDPADLSPQYLHDNRVLVNQTIADGSSRLHIIDPATGTVTEADPRPRRALDVDPITGRVVVVDPSNALWFWDPATGRDTPIALGGLRDFGQVRVALDGKSLLITSAREVWRVSLTPGVQRERVHRAIGDVSAIERAVSLPDGTVLVNETYWSGELLRIDLTPTPG